MDVNATITRLANLGIFYEEGDRVAFSPKFLERVFEMEEALYATPGFIDEVNKKFPHYTDDQREKHVIHASMTLIMVEFAGGMLKKEEAEDMLTCILKLDKLYTDTYEQQ